jgi:transcriptional antiterminator RfaH
VSAWYVVYTHAHAEAKALGHLARQGFTAYLPCCAKHRRHAGRVELVTRPLFPRYLFIWLDVLNRRWRPVLSTIGVSGLVRHGPDLATLPAGVIEEIRRREAEGSFGPVGALRALTSGQPVRVTAGAFAELVGRFISMTENERVFVLLDLLGRQVRVEVPIDAVAPA